MTPETEFQIFGIRHHGPGSARSLRRALERMAPDCILVEGPPDAAPVLELLSHADMKPPVALLLYVPEEPSRCVYYPFADYSPEWQAIAYSHRAGVPVRFMDLPQEHRLAMERVEEAAEQALERQERPATEPRIAVPVDIIEPAPEQGSADKLPEDQDTSVTPITIRHDPLNWIAEAAGYADGETWWEHMVEQRRDDGDLFQAVMETMAALRQAAPPDPDPVEAQREAWMRQTMRAARKDGFKRVAVVCGAWHGPALTDPHSPKSAKEDGLLLKGLPKVKVAATWVPWTYGRLAQSSGYGAGVPSPAWYEHLWKHPDCPAPYWMAYVATLFRSEDLPASPASVIEAVRLAEALAAVRERRQVGLAEMWEAAQSVFCFGSELPMRLIQQRLVVGERLGRVPDATPMLPIQQDLRKEQRRLRLPPEAAYADKDLDLRNATDLERSILLHRLNVLGLPWGEVQPSRGGKGTFHEIWRLQWRPEFEVRLIESNVFGNSVGVAASRCAIEEAEKTDALACLTEIVERALLADLSVAMPLLMARLESMAAVTSDVPHLMDALPPLVNVLRYGNVRQTDTAMVGHAVNGLLTRICIGLPSACSALNDEAADAMYPRLMATHESVRLLQLPDHQAAWTATLERMADLAGLHGLIDGRCCRLLLDQNTWIPDELERRMNLVLSPAEKPSRGAAWIDGLLRDSGDLLVHTDALFPIIDRWVAALNYELFPQLLPLVRRTFSTFPAPLRRRIGERARAAGPMAGPTNLPGEADIDVERAAKTLPLLAQMLGLTLPEIAGKENH